jgi:hypothetical protein
MDKDQKIIDEYNKKSALVRSLKSASYSIGSQAGFLSAKFKYHSKDEKTGFAAMSKDTFVNSSSLIFAGLLIVAERHGFSSAEIFLKYALAPVAAFGTAFDTINGFPAVKAGFAEGRKIGTQRGKNKPSPE